MPYGPTNSSGINSTCPFIYILKLSQWDLCQLFPACVSGITMTSVTAQFQHSSQFVYSGEAEWLFEMQDGISLTTA